MRVNFLEGATQAALEEKMKMVYTLLGRTHQSTDAISDIADEYEFLYAIERAAEYCMAKGAPPDVAIVPKDSPIDEYIRSGPGQVLNQVETAMGTITIIPDKWCPPDKWYFVSYEELEQAQDVADEIWEETKMWQI